MKHKYCEVIKSWAEGATIQYFNRCSLKWTDVAGNDPSWQGNTEYRVKPETARYRIGLMQYPESKPFTLTAESEDQEERWERKPGFIRWLTDWQEVEV